MVNLIFFLKFILTELLSHKIVVGVRVEILQPDFHCIEAYAIHSIHIALSDEGIRVNRFHHAHHRHALYLAAHHHQHLHVLLGEPSHAAKHRAATVSIVDNRIGSFCGKVCEINTGPNRL